MSKIRKADIEKDAKGNISEVKVVFGTNLGLVIKANNGRVEFRLGTKQFGFKADTFGIPSELEKYIVEITSRYPESRVENMQL